MSAEAIPHPHVAVKAEDPAVLAVEDEEDEDEQGVDFDGEDELELDENDEGGTLQSGGAHFLNVDDRVEADLAKTTQKTIKELYHMVNEKRIDLNPSYQRDEVWPVSRQQNLIDSIVLSRPIPALVVSVTIEDEKEKYTVIDGKQRLTAIFAFLSCKMPYKHKEHTSNKPFYWRYRNGVTPTSGYQLPEYIKTLFEETTLICQEFHDLPEHQEQDIFKRIQQGMVLVTGEKVSVGNSPRRTYIKELVIDKHLATEGKMLTRLNIDLNRGRPFINLANFAWFASHLPNKTTPGQGLIKWLDEEPRNDEDEKQEQQFLARLEETMDDFWDIAVNHGKPFSAISQRIAPAEFVFICIYLYVTQGHKVSNETRSKEIYEMRLKVHAAFPGTVRMNKTVCEFFWGLLQDVAVRPEIDGNWLPEVPDPKDDPPPPPKPARKRKTKGDNNLTNGDGSGPSTPAPKRSPKKVASAKRKAVKVDTPDDNDPAAMDVDPPKSSPSKRRRLGAPSTVVSVTSSDAE